MARSKTKLTIYIIFSLLLGVLVGLFLENRKPNPYLLARNEAISFLKNLRSDNSLPEGFSECHIDLLDNLSSLTNNAEPLDLVVGHAYGRGGVEATGEISPNFVNFLEHNNRFGTIYFTGDILAKPSIAKWNKFKKLMAIHTNNIEIAPGNHDVGHGDNSINDVFSLIFGIDYPRLITKEQDHFLLINTNNQEWTVSDEAVNKIKQIKTKKRNLYIFSHHLLQPNPAPVANSLAGFDKNAPSAYEIITEFSSDFEKVIVFSGDTGAFRDRPRFNCLQIGNVKFIASGIGGFDDDEAIAMAGSRLFRVKLLH